MSEAVFAASSIFKLPHRRLSVVSPIEGDLGTLKKGINRGTMR